MAIVQFEHPRVPLTADDRAEVRVLTCVVVNDVAEGYPATLTDAAVATILPDKTNRLEDGEGEDALVADFDLVIPTEFDLVIPTEFDFVVATEFEGVIPTDEFDFGATEFEGVIPTDVFDFGATEFEGVIPTEFDGDADAADNVPAPFRVTPGAW